MREQEALDMEEGEGKDHFVCRSMEEARSKFEKISKYVPTIHMHVHNGGRGARDKGFNPRACGSPSTSPSPSHTHTHTAPSLALPFVQEPGQGQGEDDQEA